MNNQDVLQGHSSILIGLTIFVASFCMTSEAFALTVQVSSKASGYFGVYAETVDEASIGLIEAYTFSGPGEVTLRIEGKVDLNSDSISTSGRFAKYSAVGPDGLSLARGFAPGSYLPLEEKVVDERGVAALGSSMKGLGAVFGAFVPKSSTDKPGFRPINNDFPNGGISSDRLFFVGERFDFSAEEPGTLFLGVNDCRTVNNTGSFTVNIEEK